jgi:predicted ATP-dependent endonuclease of OLD family
LNCCITLEYYKLIQSTTIFVSGRINIITGPNYSGKSIYIKQVCLLLLDVPTLLNRIAKKDGCIGYLLSGGLGGFSCSYWKLRSC